MKTINGFTRMAALAAAGLAFTAFFGTVAAGQNLREEHVTWTRPQRVEPKPAPVDVEFDDKPLGWLSDRLSLGLGISHMRLTDNHRSPSREDGKTFVGRLNLLELEDKTQLTIVANLWFMRYLRASLSWENVEARTFNYDVSNPYGAHGQTDGIVKISGPVLSLEGVWPLLDDTLFPHVGAGLFFGQADFKEDTFWHLGYSSQASYDTYGRPSHTRSGFRREIHVEDTVGWLASAGIAWRPVKHFQVDLEVRQTWADIDCEYGYLWNKTDKGWDPHRTGDFTLDNLTWVISAAYVF